jgi:hypothetical protein
VGAQTSDVSCRSPGTASIGSPEKPSSQLLFFRVDARLSPLAEPSESVDPSNQNRPSYARVRSVLKRLETSVVVLRTRPPRPRIVTRGFELNPYSFFSHRFALGPFRSRVSAFRSVEPIGVKVLSDYRRVPRRALRLVGADGARCIEIDNCFPERDASTRARVRFATVHRTVTSGVVREE